MLEKFKVQNYTGRCKCGTKVYLPFLFLVTSLNVHYLKQGTVWLLEVSYWIHQQIYRNIQGAYFTALLWSKALKRKYIYFSAWHHTVWSYTSSLCVAQKESRLGLIKNNALFYNCVPDTRETHFIFTWRAPVLWCSLRITLPLLSPDLNTCPPCGN